MALVVGRTDVGDFARSHTGALATSWKTTRAALRQAGAVLVDDERELVDAVAALSRRRLAPSADPGVGLVTAQAGPGLLFAGSRESARLEVAEIGSGHAREHHNNAAPHDVSGEPGRHRTAHRHVSCGAAGGGR